MFEQLIHHCYGSSSKRKPIFFIGFRKEANSYSDLQ